MKRTVHLIAGFVWVPMLAGLLALLLAAPVRAQSGAPQPDPSGTSTGDRTTVTDAGGNAFVTPPPAPGTKAGDPSALAYQAYAAQAKAEPLAGKLADAVGHLKVGANMNWVLSTGYLVLFMQAGFALLTVGLVRKKNAGHLMMLNFAAYVIAFIGFFAVGFAIMYGGAAINGAGPAGIGGTPTLNAAVMLHGKLGILFGKTGWFLSGSAYDAGVFGLVMFEVVFMETAGYIIVGAICERITFKAFVLCELFIGALLYPIFGCWVWGGGWLSQIGNSMHLGHGYVDFAGSTVVHAVGGFCAMALAVLLGPRLGKYDKKGRPVAFPGHNIVFVVTGTFILLFGWMGFNPGSTLAATDLRISIIAVNTNLAAIFGAATAMLFWTFKFGKPDISMACNGMLAGLVAITAPCAFVNAPDACVIGVLAGLLVCVGVLFNEKVLKVDDPCGAVSVHGYCGWLGGICVGIFADGTYGQGWNGTGTTRYIGTAGSKLMGVTGILHGDPSQLVAQVVGSTVCVAWAFGATWVVFKLVNKVVKLRVSPEVELQGLDVPEFGQLAYPEDEVPEPVLAVEAAPRGAPVIGSPATEAGA
ncbi:MAG: ammonium transporter [Armatimonadetes bacterium]|nr:ammonium transporter [Armatimonadota bacterium]MDE2206974.1 ammonium transporter [Armatimonadota bacterium]